jgi:hypothetical protein
VVNLARAGVREPKKDSVGSERAEQDCPEHGEHGLIHATRRQRSGQERSGQIPEPDEHFEYAEARGMLGRWLGPADVVELAEHGEIEVNRPERHGEKKQAHGFGVAEHERVERSDREHPQEVLTVSGSVGVPAEQEVEERAGDRRCADDETKRRVAQANFSQSEWCDVGNQTVEERPQREHDAEHEESSAASTSATTVIEQAV